MLPVAAPQFCFLPVVLCFVGNLSPLCAVLQVDICELIFALLMRPPKWSARAVAPNRTTPEFTVRILHARAVAMQNYQ